MDLQCVHAPLVGGVHVPSCSVGLGHIDKLAIEGGVALEL